MPAFRNLADKIIPPMGDVFWRFPVPLMQGGILSLYMMAAMNGLFALFGLFPLALVATFFWSLFASLFAEAWGRQPVTGHIAGIIGSSIILLLGAYPLIIDFSLTLFTFAIAIAISVAPFGKGGADKAGFWQFNHSLWLGFFISIFAGVLFFAGIASILGTLKYLFGISLLGLLPYFGAIAFGIVGPIAWLGLVPKRFDLLVAQGPQKEFLSSAVAALVKYILVPLLLLYALILHIYAAKIGVEWSLPRGRLGWMVLSFGGVVSLTALLIFPTHHSGGTLNRFFWRYWPVMLMVPTALLFVSVGTRISQYGFTDRRYLVLLMGIWLAVLAIVFSFWTKGRDLRLVPGLLALLMLAASIGPWSMSGLSSRWQAAEFIALLERAGLAREGRLLVNKHISDSTPTKVRRRLGSILAYLNRKGRLDLLAPVFEGRADNPFKDRNMIANHTKMKNSYQARSWRRRQRDNTLFNALKKQLPFSEIDRYRRHKRSNQRNFHAHPHQSAKVKGVGWITGQIVLFNRKAKLSRSVDIMVGAQSVAVSFNSKTVIVTHRASNTQAVFEIVGNKALRDATSNRVLKSPSPAKRKNPISIEKRSGQLDVRLVLNRAGSWYGPKGKDILGRVNIALIFPKLPGAPK